MKAELYGKKMAIEKKLDLYNKLNNVLSDAYPFFEGDSETLEPMYEIVSGKVRQFSIQYQDLMNQQIMIERKSINKSKPKNK